VLGEELVQPGLVDPADDGSGLLSETPNEIADCR